MDNNHEEMAERNDTLAVIWRARDIAELYGVDESTVRRWERSGTLRAARRDPGGNKYWLRDEILADSRAGPDAHRELATALLEGWVSTTRRPRRRREVAR